jgi:hypothetical protein
MPRTVVPPMRGRVIRGEDEQGPGADQGDSLPEKLVKYVPAETLAFFIPVSAAVGDDRDVLLLVATAIAAIGTAAYLWLNAQKLEDRQKPLPHFYVLAVLAFLAWAIGTATNLAKLLGMDDVVAGIVLLAGIFLIPLADGVLNQLLRRPASPRLT